MGIYALNTNKKTLKHYAAPVEQVAPKVKPTSPSKTKTVAKKASAVSKQWLMFLLTAFVLFVATLVLLIASRANFVTQSKSLENLQLELSDIQEDKMHAEQQVNELSNYDRLIKIAEENGLEVHEENIRNVSQ